MDSDARPGNGLHDLAPVLLSLGCALAYAVWRRRQPASGESFRGQTVIITGGSRGLGFALARWFAAEGATLALLARDVEELAAAGEALGAPDAGEVLIVPCDVTDRAAVNAAVTDIAERTGRIDVLVNNAGVIQITPFEHAQLEDFQDSLDTHFWGPLYLTRACLPYFLRQKRGRIVNIASIGGRVAVPHLLPYSVGKFALVGLSEGLHAELAPRGVSVTTVIPHLMRTGSHRNALVRGQHFKEAAWFALGTATPLTALDADRAAEEIVRAVRAGRSHVTLGWPARAAEIAQAMAPELVAAIAAFVAGSVLPSASADADGDRGRESREVDTGMLAHLFATDAALRFNQRLAPDEMRRPLSYA